MPLLHLLACVALLGWAVVHAEEPAQPFADWPRGWTLGLGAEFPGAQGALDPAADGDLQVLRLAGDFAGGGNYVSVGRSFPVPFDLDQLTVRVRGDAPAFWLRLTEGSGQTFQQRIALDPAEAGWRTVRIREFGDPACTGIVRWGGSADGLWRGPARSLALILARSDLGGRTAAALEFAGVEAAGRPAGAEPPERTLVVSEFVRDVDGWTLGLGGEFPGAKGSALRAEVAGGPVAAALRVEADFSGGGRYVSIGRSWPAPLALRDLRLLVRTGVRSLAVRVGDAEGQVFQQYLTPARDPEAWQELAVKKLADPADKAIFHWGGRNDGVLRGGVRSLSLLVNAPIEPGAGTVWIGRITARAAAGSVRLAPLGAPLSFLVQEGRPARLAWKADSEIPPDGLRYDLVDYQGGLVASGTAVQDGERTVSCQVSPPLGYHEVVFRRNGAQRFGLICQDHPVERPDPYFAVDAALEFFSPGDDPVGRVSYLRLLRQTGITMIRERFGWRKKAWEEGRFDFARWNRKELRNEAVEHGIGILEDFCPIWNGKLEEPLPTDVLRFRSTLDLITAQLGPGWTASEFWNEPDIACTTPGDVYGACFRVAAQHMTARFPGRPIIGGVFNNQVNRANFETYAANGVLDHCDVFSYHDYTPAEKTVDTAARFRAWAAAAGRGDIPMWITETGAGWTTGPERAPVEEDRACARRMAWKTVEAKACGIERYFAFLLVFFEEGAVNWGMHDKRHTPLRLMGSYAAAARLLAHAGYRGDVRTDDPAVVAMRTFVRPERADEAIVVVAMKGIDALASTVFPAAVRAVRGADGRLLAARPDGRIPVPDGLGYVELRLADLAPHLVADTPIARLLAQSATRTTTRIPAPSVVIVPAVDPAQACHSPNGYYLQDPERCTMAAAVVNLSDRPQEVAFAAVVPAGVEHLDGPRSLVVPPGASVPAAWSFRFRPSAAGDPPRDLTVRVPGLPGCAWTMRFLASEAATAARAPAAEPAPGLPVPGPGWKELGAEAYVPWGVVLHDGRTKAWARYTWTPQELRVEVLVDKPGHHQPALGADIWQGDSVQVAFQAGGLGMTAAGFTEIAAALTAKGPQVWRHAAESRDPKRLGALDAQRLLRVQQSGERIHYALRLPVAEFDLPALKAGLVIRCALVINLNDGRARIAYLRWGEGIAHAKAPAEYCLMKLVE
jgi:hypothetical protein